jgi:predicted lactoylglutathione lyase
MRLCCPRWDSPAGWRSTAGCNLKQLELVSRRNFLASREARGHTANECRIAFWAQSTAEVDRLAHIVAEKGGRQIEGPGYLEGAGYYAVFFEDPSGNRLEICHRVAGAI